MAYIILAAFLWGITGTIAKFIYKTSINPFMLVEARLTFSFLILFLFLLFKNKNLLKIEKSDLIYFAILGMIGYSSSQFLYLYTISLTNVGIAVLLQSFSSILAVLYSIIKKEPLDFKKIVAVFVSLIGISLVIFGNGNLSFAINPLALLTGIGSAFFVCFNIIISQKLLIKYNAWTVITYGFGFGMLIWFILLSPYKVFPPIFGDNKVLLSILYISVFSTVIAFGLYTMGLKKVHPTTVTILGTLEPVVAAIIAYIFLKEKLTLLQISGGILVIIAIISLQYNKKNAKNHRNLKK